MCQATHRVPRVGRGSQNQVGDLGGLIRDCLRSLTDPASNPSCHNLWVLRFHPRPSCSLPPPHCSSAYLCGVAAGSPRPTAVHRSAPILSSIEVGPPPPPPPSQPRRLLGSCCTPHPPSPPSALSSSSWSADSLTSWWRIRPAVGSVTAWSCRYLGLLLLLFSVLVYLTGSILAAVNSKHLTNINNK